jgi:hypothetical protein
MAVAGCVFAAVYLRTSVTKTPVVTPQTIVSASPKEDFQSSTSAEDTALALTRKHAKQVAIMESTPSDPFTKAVMPDVNEVQAPPVTLRRPVTNRPSGGKKPLIVASGVSVEQEPMTPDVIATDVAPVEPQPRFHAAPIMAMRSSAALVQSDQQVGTATTSQGGGFGATPASYMPSAAMELTESQNRLRSLLQ